VENQNRLSFGYPAALALSLDKEAYAVMRGSFSEKGMSQFIHGLVNGRQRTIKLQRMPQVVTVTP
jgi:protein disulfide-isomerase A6